MPKLVDAKGREFEARRITVGDYDDLAALGLDVEGVSEDLGLLAEVVRDRRKFAALLWWFVGGAVEAAKLTPRDFYQGLDGDALSRGAHLIRDAVIDFFPYPPQVKAKLIADLTAGQNPAAGSDVAPASTRPLPADSTPAP